MGPLRYLAAAGLAAVLSGCGGSTPPTAVATSPPTEGPGSASPAPSGPFSSGTSSPSAGGDASTAVTEYFNAVRSSDCAAAFGLLTDPLRGRVASADALCRGAGPNEQSASATVSTSSGDPATGQVSIQVSVTRSDGSVHSDNVIVVLKDGSWKISDIMVNPAGGAVAGQITMDTIIATITQQYSGQAGGATITLSCPRSGSFPATPGDSFQCDFSDTNGRKGKLTISVTSARGDYTWSVG